MSWVAVGVGVVGAVAGAANAKSQAAAANRAAKTAANTTTNVTRNPWGPSVDARAAGIQRAQQLLGSWNGDISHGESAPAPAPTGGQWRPNRPAATTTTAPNPAASNPWAGFSGISQGTQDSINRLQDRANAGSPLYDPANQFTIGLLNGQDPNAYRQETFDRMQNLSDPYLDQYINMLFSGQMPGSGGGADLLGNGGSSGRYNYSNGGAGGGGDLVGAKQALADRIAGKDLDVNDPRVQAMVDASTRDIDKKFHEVDIPGVNDTFAGAGRFGGGLYATALADSSGQYAQNVADAMTKVRFDDYEARKADQAAALQEGSQYDLGVLQNDSAASAAGASAANAAADRAQQLELAKMNALQGAIGQHTGLLQFGSQGMSGLAGMYSQDQMNALGLVPQLSGLDLRDLQAATGANLDADKNKIGMYDATQQAKARQAANSIARGQLAFSQQQYNDNLPWQQLGNYTNILQGLSGAYGTEQSQGVPYQPSQTPSMWGSALTGGLAGYYGAGGNFGAPSTGPTGSYYGQGAGYFYNPGVPQGTGYYGAGTSADGTYGYGNAYPDYLMGGH